MSIKTFFDSLAKKREKKHKYAQLATAIKTGDVAGVQTALAAGAETNYFPGNTKKMPFALALQKGDVKIFEELLKNPDEAYALSFWHYDFRSLKSRPGEMIYFTPSIFYAAIEMGREDIALLLVKHPFVHVERGGDVFRSDNLNMHDKNLEYLVKTPLQLAQENGLTRIADAITERLKPALAQRAQAEAAELEAKAVQKRAEADQLAPKTAAHQPPKKLTL